LKSSSAKMVKVGDILFALYGATSGEVAISKITGAINQAILCIKSKQNHYFIYSYLIHKKDHIVKVYLQGGQGNLSAEIVKGIEIPIPILLEQNFIANLLLTINNKKDTEKEFISKYHRQKKFLLSKLFI
jgi:type I restriction enzyme S subunit